MNNQKKLLYVGYVRISGSTEQKNRNLSIPSQIEQINQYAKNHPEIVIKTIYKEVHSAFKGWKRPIFRKMCEDLSLDKKITWVIVFKRDRVSRNPDDYLSLQNIRGTQNPVDVISVTEPMITSYLGRYMIRDLQNRSILYSEELSFRVKLWQRKKLQMWGYPYSTPYGYKKIEWRLFPDEKKQEIVKYVYKEYAKWKLWIKNLAKKTNDHFKEAKVTKSKVEAMLSNTIYYWMYTAKRNLTKENYLLFGADWPGVLEEKYMIKSIEPILTKEEFENIQLIKEYKKTCKKQNYRRANAKFPKIYMCSCGRKLRRYDRKWVRYLFCPKDKNTVHGLECYEWHTSLNILDDQIERLIRSIIPSANLRQQAHKRIREQNMNASKDLNTHLKQLLQDIHIAEEKLTEVQECYISSEITKETYTSITKKLKNTIHERKIAIQTYDSDNDLIQSRKKIGDLMNIFEKREQMLEESETNKKSSQVYAMVFKAFVNLTITGRNISKYQLFPLFDILKCHRISQWQREQDLNLQLRCRRPLCSQLHYPSIYIKLFHLVHLDASQDSVYLTAPVSTLLWLLSVLEDS